jgi:hypothetical protein
MGSFDIDDPLYSETDYEPSKQKKPRKRERIAGPFYQVSEGWADKATEAAGGYAILALRLYRWWRGRPTGADVVAVTTAALDGPGYSRRGKLEVLSRLSEAGLVEVTERAPRRAARVRVVDPQLLGRDRD